MIVMSESIRSLLISMSVNGNVLSTGTGFVANTSKGPVLVTNRHNLTGRHQSTGQPLSPTGGVPDTVTIVHNGQTTASGHQWVTRQELLSDHQGNPRWIEHPTLGVQADFVALPLTNLTGVTTHVYDPKNPGAPIAVTPGDIVSVIGFPFGITGGAAFAIWATGFIATEPDVPWNGMPMFLVDCRSRPGQSGSPVVAFRNGGLVPTLPIGSGNASAFNGPVSRFMGIYSGRINDQSDLGMVWTAAAVAQLIDSI